MKQLPPEARSLPNTEAKIVFPQGMSERDKGIIYQQLTTEFINNPPANKGTAYRRMAEIIKGMGFTLTPYKGSAYQRRCFNNKYKEQ